LIKSSLNPQYISGIVSLTPTAVSLLTPVPAAPTPLLIPINNIGSVKDDQPGGEECGVSVTAELQPLAGSCGTIRKVASEEMP